jgi:hypothetical protein
MSLPIKILTYESEDAPFEMQACALITYRMDGKLTVHPARFLGADVDDVREQAQGWWDSEVAKARENARGLRGKPRTTTVTPEVLSGLDTD